LRSGRFGSFLWCEFPTSLNDSHRVRQLFHWWELARFTHNFAPRWAQFPLYLQPTGSPYLLIWYAWNLIFRITVVWVWWAWRKWIENYFCWVNLEKLLRFHF
jgi:hypothetical protein